MLTFSSLGQAICSTRDSSMVACQTEISGTRLVTHASRVTAPRYKNRVSGHRRSDKIVLEIVPRRGGWYLSQSTVVQVAGTYRSQRLRNI